MHLTKEKPCCQGHWSVIKHTNSPLLTGQVQAMAWISLEAEGLSEAKETICCTRQYMGFSFFQIQHFSRLWIIWRLPPVAKKRSSNFCCWRICLTQKVSWLSPWERVTCRVGSQCNLCHWSLLHECYPRCSVTLAEFTYILIFDL